MEKKELIRTVWVGSYGWRFNEPIGGLIADVNRFTFDQFVEMLEDEAYSYAEFEYELAYWEEMTFEKFAENLVFYYTEKPEVMYICEEHQKDFEELGYAAIGDCGCELFYERVR